MFEVIEPKSSNSIELNTINYIEGLFSKARDPKTKTVYMGYDPFFLEESMSNLLVDQVLAMFEIGSYYEIKTDSLMIKGKITEIENNVCRGSKIISVLFDDNGDYGVSVSIQQDVDENGWWYFNNINLHNCEWGGEFEAIDYIRKLDEPVEFCLNYESNDKSEDESENKNESINENDFI